jgi:hypothetical protein
MAERARGVICTDMVGWYDSDGPDFNCNFYLQANACAHDGDYFENDGQTGNTACCTCGGGCSDAAGWYDESPSEYLTLTLKRCWHQSQH